MPVYTPQQFTAFAVRLIPNHEGRVDVAGREKQTFQAMGQAEATQRLTAYGVRSAQLDCEPDDVLVTVCCRQRNEDETELLWTKIIAAILELRNPGALAPSRAPHTST